MPMWLFDPKTMKFLAGARAGRACWLAWLTPALRLVRLIHVVDEADIAVLDQLRDAIGRIRPLRENRKR